METSACIRIKGHDWTVRTVPFRERVIRIDDRPPKTGDAVFDPEAREIVVAGSRRPGDLVMAVADSTLLAVAAEEARKRKARRERKASVRA